MRILYVTSYYKPAYSYGGPVRSISAMCEGLSKLGADVTVLTTNANGDQRLDVPLGQPIMLNGVEVNYYPIIPVLPRSFFYSPSLAQACGKKIRQFDIAVLEMIFSHTVKTAMVACRQASVPYIVPLRGQLLPWSLSQKHLKKNLYMALVGRSYLDHAAALHCTVPAEAEAVTKLGVQTPKIIVPNGVDTKRFAHLPARGGMRQRLGIPLEANLLLFLGRLHKKKRPDIAVAALAAAQSLPGETHLVLAGPDEMQLVPRLQAQAQQLGCANRLHVTGTLEGDDILFILGDADLLLMPSEPASENFGMSAVEAMAAGVPILVSDGVPVGSWAEKAGAGRVVACTSEAFRQMTCELLGSRSALRNMGQMGQILARERFDISMVAQQMLGQCQAIVSTGRPIPG